MPYPSQTDRDTIIDTARAMIEAEGVANLSLRNLADTLGVKAPSLYRYVQNKTELLRAINQRLIAEMRQELHAVAQSNLGADERMIAVAKAFRRFVHRNPACYMLSANIPPTDEPGSHPFAVPMQSILAEITADEDALPALRGAYAFIHGWVVLELMQQFACEGDLTDHFERSFRAYLAGW
ncbi:MAG: TetR/AcrR family transcriptional regulator [Anaerolineae bacterium]